MHSVRRRVVKQKVRAVVTASGTTQFVAGVGKRYSCMKLVLCGYICMCFRKKKEEKGVYAQNQKIINM